MCETLPGVVKMTEDQSEKTRVKLHIYDLTKGMARSMSPLFLGRQIEGIWHTAVVVFGREYFFGVEGILKCFPGGTILGAPDKEITLGETFIPYTVFEDYLNGLRDSTFSKGTYSLFKHNCNNFSNELSQFLCGQNIPQYILDLPQEFLNTPLGASLIPLIEQLSSTTSGGGGGFPGGGGIDPEWDRLSQDIEDARRRSIALEEKRNVINEKLAKRERKNNKKNKKSKTKESSSKRPSSRTIGELTPDEGNSSGSGESKGASPPVSLSNPSENIMAEQPPVEGSVELEPTATESDQKDKLRLAADVAAEIDADERREKEEERKRKPREPPIVFKDVVDVRIEFDNLVGHIENIMTTEDQQSLEELHQYMLEDEGSWALGEGFLNFIGRLLHDKSLRPEIPLTAILVLASAALKDDVILLLHQDRREHILMNYAYEIDRLSLPEQQALALFICNMFENLSSSEWLMYISEWSYCNQTISNIRVTTKVCVHALLADDPVLQDRGTAIVHNLACKEVKTVIFDDIAMEITMALLQYFNSKPPEERLFRCMKALARFSQVSRQDVAQLIQMIGPDPKQFIGISERIDAQIELIRC